MYKQASKLKLRFTSSKGLLTVEDLWDLSLTSTRGVNLDEVAKTATRQLQEQAVESFVESATVDSLPTLRLDIVKDIIAVRMAQAKEIQAAILKKTKRDKILAIMAAKQDASLESQSMDELAKMLEEL